MKLNVAIFSIICILLFLCIVGLAWLVLGAGVYIALFFTGKLNFRWIHFLKKHAVLKGMLTLFFVFISTIAFRIFVAEIYNVPSESMENTLLDGDNILLSKLHYGPKLPESPAKIPWFSLLYFFNKKIPDDKSDPQWPYCRLSGFSTVQRGDILVFKLADLGNTQLIKRCVAEPGDTLTITNGRVAANRIIPAPIKTAREPYIIKITDSDRFRTIMEDMNINFDFDSTGKNIAHANLTLEDKERLVRSGSIASIDFEPVVYDNWSHVYPWDHSFNWTIDDYGPIVIPSKGMTMVLTKTNYIIYKKVFDLYEAAPVRELNNRFYINDQEIKEYTFKEDYCFVLGDNRHYSNDSRYLGFVPLKNVEGKAICILFSRAKGHFNWKRLLKIL
jgi:signal peptidase I